MLSFNILYPYLIKFPYFMDTIDLSLKGRFGGKRKPKYKVKT
jgi:hypothetical protein